MMRYGCIMIIMSESLLDIAVAANMTALISICALLSVYFAL